MARNVKTLAQTVKSKNRPPLIFVENKAIVKMRTINTEIIINASPAEVWKTLTQFEAYPEWNPFIRSIKGKAIVGEQIEAQIHPPGQNPMTFTPHLLVVETNRELRWLGKLFIKGLFDGEHYFRIHPTTEGHSRFEHGENFRGLLAGLLIRMVGESTQAGFETMNKALKNRVEANQMAVR